MSGLPDRPNLDQLRHRARELHRAAVGGDADAARRLSAVSNRVTLSAAQSALAHEYGFANWSRLKAEVERRREARPAAPVRGWKGMRESSARILLARTGEDVDAWNRRIADTGIDTEAALRAWLDGRDVTGYAQALLVWERFGYPDFLTADADALIDGQYADRPHLRPVLDAVLAALPAIGEVTVQARKTCVSLVSPRRTFAVVQATTKNRVDVGLRLAEVEVGDMAPAGRLVAAKNLGNFPVRLGLTGPENVDDEAVGWLRRAYEENDTPTVKRPAVRSTAKTTVLAVRVDGVDLPGISCRPEGDGTTHRAVHVGLCSREKERPGLTVPDRPWRVVEPVPGDAVSARWDFDITVRPAAGGGSDFGGFDFGGPFVQGDRTDRHLKLAWGDAPGDGTLRLFRAAKLRLAETDEDLVAAATRPGHRLVARIRLTDAKGQPICARLRPPDIAWLVEAVGRDRR
jgi:hypothetical protein